jgi:hypothetical protein
MDERKFSSSARSVSAAETVGQSEMLLQVSELLHLEQLLACRRRIHSLMLQRPGQIMRNVLFSQRSLE